MQIYEITNLTLIDAMQWQRQRQWPRKFKHFEWFFEEPAQKQLNV